MLRPRPTYGLALILGGFALLAVGAAIEASIALSGGFEYGYSGTDLGHLLVVPWALGFIFAGYYLDHPEVLWGRKNGARVAATYLLFTDGAIHVLAIGEHIDLPVVAFFLVLAPLQWLGAFYLLHGSRTYLKAWLVAAVGLIALYLASRLTTLPFVTQNLLYRFAPLGIVSKAVEILLIAVIARELWTTHRVTRKTVEGRPATQS